MRILVTGGAGFIASHLTDELVQRGHSVSVIDNLASGQPGNINKSIKFYFEDICSRSIKAIFKDEKPDCVIHHAAQPDVTTSLRDPWLDAQTNILGFINVLENSIYCGTREFILASSAAVYGEPIYLGIDEKHRKQPNSFYGLSKYCSEQYLAIYSRFYGISFTILRYANVYGPRQRNNAEGGVISIFINNMLNGRPVVIYGNGEQTRDFIYVSDVVAANIKALSNSLNQAINIGTGKSLSLNALYKLLQQILNIDIPPLYEQPKKGDILHSYLANQKALHYLNWKPQTDLICGLKKTIDYASSLPV